MKKKKKIIIGVAALFLSLTAIFIYYGLTAGQSAKTRESYTLGKMDPLTFQGAVEPKSNQEVYLDAGLGKLKKTNVKNGQKVKKGDVLLTYVNETVEGQMKEQKRQVNRAQENINSAQRTLNRARSKLYRIEDNLNDARRKAKKAGISYSADPSVTSLKAERDAQIEAVEAQKETVLSAIADRDDAKAALEDSKTERYEKVKAKISGTVKLNEEGKNNATVPLVTVYSKGVMIEATASEYDYPYLKEDGKVDIYINSTEENMKGEISSVDDLAVSSTDAQSVGGVSYAFQVVPEEKIQYGFSVQVKVPIEEIRIPEEYVLEEDGNYYVFRYEGESAVKEPVSLEKKEGYYIVTEPGEELETKEADTEDIGTTDTLNSSENATETNHTENTEKSESASISENNEESKFIHKLKLKEGETLILPDKDLKSGDKVVIADDNAEED